MESYLSVVVRDRQDATVLTLSGELDMASSPMLIQALDGVEKSGGRRLILDLQDLEFLDVTALRVLLRARERARSTGGELLLTNVQGEVRRVIGITGADDLLPIME